MTPNREGSGSNAMELIMSLENRCRILTESRNEWRTQALLAMSLKSPHWWLGFGVGAIVCNLVWVVGRML